MTRRLFYSFLCLALLLSYKLLGQNPQVGIMPMRYNPSFAGSAGNSRLVTNFSYQYQESTSSYTSWYYYGHNYGMNLSFDTYIPKIRSGIGITSDLNSNHFITTEANGVSNSGSINLIIAPKISIKGKYTISPSFEYSYKSWYFEGIIYRDSAQNFRNAKSGFSGRFGLLFNAKHYYIGYALLVSNDFKPYFGDDQYGVIQFGYCFQRNADSKFSFTPQFVLPIEVYTYSSNKVYNLDLGYTLNFRYNNLLLGVVSNTGYWYPTGFMAGWQKNNWRIMMNNSFKAEDPEYYADILCYRADLSFRYIFNKDKKSIHIFD